MIIASGIEVSDRDKAEAAILREVEACQEGRITEEEILSAKRSVANALRTLYDDPAALISWYFKRLLIGSTESPEAYGARIEAVTLEDMVKAAKSLTLDTIYFLNGTLPGEEDDDCE
jgi:predicted Zn-dependent peptidase